MVQSKQMADWHSQSPGKNLLAAERLALQSLLADKFGYHALQLGRIKGNNWLESSRMLHKIFLSPVADDSSANNRICADFAALPFAPDSIDLAVVPHVLEFAAEPLQILQEIYTVLIPEGYIVVLGYNPLSLWGGTKLIKSRRCYPWHGQFVTSYRVRRWLRDIGYWVVDHKSLFFRPPLASSAWQEKLLFLEGVGQMLWPYFGAAFLIVAQKRTTKPIPICAREKPKRVSVRHGVVQPTRLNR
ncbi:MAG: methyltransferase domain-containing protein [Gammaproteobacteria bacterium]